jgi:hypothetical protein
VEYLDLDVKFFIYPESGMYTSGCIEHSLFTYDALYIAREGTAITRRKGEKRKK